MNRITLPELTADSVVGYLAAIGTLRLVVFELGDDRATLAWPDGAYSPPVLSTSIAAGVDDLAEAIFALVEDMRVHDRLVPNLDGWPIRASDGAGSDPMRKLPSATIDPIAPATWSDWRLADWVPAFVGASAPNENAQLSLSRFMAVGPGTVWVERTINGLLHEIETSASLANGLASWKRTDSIGAYLDGRADVEASRSAASKGAAEKYGEPAATWLALQALPVFPVRGAASPTTVGWFRALKGRGFAFRYPVWSGELCLPDVTVLVDHELLARIDARKLSPRTRARLGALGVCAVFESVREVMGNYNGPMRQPTDLFLVG